VPSVFGVLRHRHRCRVSRGFRLWLRRRRRWLKLRSGRVNDKAACFFSWLVPPQFVQREVPDPRSRRAGARSAGRECKG